MSTIESIQAHLDTALRAARLSDDRELTGSIRDDGRRLVFLLHGLVRSSRLYGNDNDALASPSEEAARVLGGLLERLGVVSVMFVEDQIYVNEVRLRVRSMEQQAVLQIIGDVSRHGVGQISFHHGLCADHIRRLARVIGEAPAPEDPALSLAKRLKELGDIEISGPWHFRLTDDESKEAEDHGKIVQRALATVAETFDRAALGRSPNPLPVRRVVIDLVDSLRQHPELAALAPFSAPTDASATHRHLISTCQLSLLLGRTLGLSDTALSDLGVAAVFHDVGAILTTDPRRHARSGARVLLRQRGFSEARVRRLLAVAEHDVDYAALSEDHELPSLFGRIIRLAEDYDLLLTDIADKSQGLPPPMALAAMWSGRGIRYDQILASLFVQALGLLPAGTLVQLSDGRKAMVVSAGRGRERFTLPVVRIWSGEAYRIDGETLDLFEARASVGVGTVLDAAKLPAAEGERWHRAVATAAMPGL